VTRGVVAWLGAAALVVTAMPFVSAVAQRPAPGAPIDVAEFGYARAVPRGDGLTLVTLDAAMLAHSRLDDIRVVDGRQRQVPYVIEPAAEPLELTLPPLEPTAPRTRGDDRLPADAAKRTWYRARLTYAGLPDAVLRLRTNERVFERQVLFVPGPPPRDPTMGYAGPLFPSGHWSHGDPATPADPLEVTLPGRVRTDSVFVLVDDGDNHKLAITDATLRLRTYRLRFFRDASDTLRVLYGHAGLAAPRYDLALVAGRLRDSSATPVALGPERSLQAVAEGRSRVVFWSVLTGTVLVLLALVARLVAGEQARGV
jgi:hypothetical protein